MSKPIILGCGYDDSGWVSVLYGRVAAVPVTGQPVRLTGARLIDAWEIEEWGSVIYLATHGPRSGARISPAVPEMVKTVWKEFVAVTDKSATAIDAWPAYEEKARADNEEDDNEENDDEEEDSPHHPELIEMLLRPSKPPSWTEEQFRQDCQSRARRPPSGPLPWEKPINFATAPGSATWARLRHERGACRHERPDLVCRRCTRPGAWG